MRFGSVSRCLAIALAGLSSVATAPPANADLPSRALPLDQFLDAIDGRLLDVREIELRQIESREKIRHLDQARAFELGVEGKYQGDDLHRLEVNGNNQKSGRLREYDRTVRFELTRPILGQSLEDRLIQALEKQRLGDLEFEAEVTQRQAVLAAIGRYLDLYESQEELRVAERAVEVTAERVRVLNLRAEEGESLLRDQLEAEAIGAKWRLTLAKTRRRHAEVLADIQQDLVGEPLAPFRAVPLDWQALIDAMAADHPDAGPPGGLSDHSDDNWSGLGGTLWYTIPELDLTLAYETRSLDRYFANEQRRERGHTPEVQLSLELPLDFFRAARAFRRQVEARQERRTLERQRLERRLAARAADVQLAVDEARAALDLAESEFAYQQEELRVTRLRVDAGEVDIDRAAEIVLLDAELDVLDADARLAIARSRLAETVFEYEVGRGRSPRELLSSAIDAAANGSRAASTVDPIGGAAGRRVEGD